MSTALADLYTLWPNRLSVDVSEIVLGPTPHNVVHTVADAITTPISTKEAATSNGVYTRTLTSFFLPAMEVTGWVPQAGYLLHDDRVLFPELTDGTPYTINDVTAPVAGGLWLCSCVFLRIDPQRADVISIIYPALATRDAYGSRILTPAYQETDIPCWIQPLSQDEVDQLDKRGFKEYYYCYVLDSANMQNIVYGSTVTDQNGDSYIVLKLEQRRCYMDADRLLLAIMPEAQEVAP